LLLVRSYCLGSPRGRGHQAGERWPSCGESTHSSGVARTNPANPGSSQRIEPPCEIPVAVVGMGKSGKSPKVSAKSDVVELSKRQANAKAKKTAREKQKAAAQARIKHALGVKRAAQLENCVKYCLQQKPPIRDVLGRNSGCG